MDLMNNFGENDKKEINVYDEIWQVEIIMATYIDSISCPV